MTPSSDKRFWYAGIDSLKGLLCINKKNFSRVTRRSVHQRLIVLAAQKLIHLAVSLFFQETLVTKNTSWALLILMAFVFLGPHGTHCSLRALLVVALLLIRPGTPSSHQVKSKPNQCGASKMIPVQVLLPAQASFLT